MSSRMIFWSNKYICTLIWMPSKSTQMSVNPNHYLEPCHMETVHIGFIEKNIPLPYEMKIPKWPKIGPIMPKFGHFLPK